MAEEVQTTTIDETKIDETKVDETKVIETKVEDKTPQLTSEQQAAINLYESLKNPDTALQTLEGLAGLTGLSLTKKAEKTELKRSIAESIKEGLGDEHSFLAEKLGPTLDKIINDAIEGRVKEVTTILENRDKAEFATRVDEVFKTLERESKGLSKQLETEMVKIMDEISPGPNTKPEIYIQHVYDIAKSRYDEAERIKAQNTKRAENKTAASVQTGVNADRVKTGSKLPTIKEAVEAAMRGETLE